MRAATDRLISVRDAAERVGASRWFIRTEITAGRLHALRLGGTKRPMLRIRQSDFDAWLKLGEQI